MSHSPGTQHEEGAGAGKAGQTAALPETKCGGPIGVIKAIPLTHKEGRPHSPDLVWTGSEFGVAWINVVEDNQSHVDFARVDKVGNKNGEKDRLTNTSAARSFAMTWTGSQYAVISSSETYSQVDEKRSIDCIRVDSSGNKIEGAVRVKETGSAFGMDVAWTGSEFGLAWTEQIFGASLLEYALRFIRIKPDGQSAGSELEIASPIEYNPSLVWTGKEFALAWEEEYGPCGTPGHVDPACRSSIYLQRLDAQGKSIGNKYKVSSGKYDCKNPGLAWTGSEFGIVWEDENDYWKECPPLCNPFQIHFARVNSAGNKVEKETRLSGSGGYYPAVVWAGSKFGVGWSGYWQSQAFMQVSALGDASGSSVQVTSSADYGSQIVLAWTGSEIGAVWTDGRDGAGEVYFARIGPCMSD